MLDVTVITAYIDIGGIIKGPSMRNRTHYLQWMQVWRKMKNSVVFYTNNVTIEQEFIHLRSIYGYPTRTVLVDSENITNPSTLWSFTLLPNITAIFTRPGYPQYPPYTVNAMYSAVIHSKLDMVERVILSNPYGTQRFAWMDVGILRTYPEDAPCFEIHAPPQFDQSKIAMNQITDNFISNHSISTIILRDSPCVGGGVFFGVNETFLAFIKQFRRAVIKLLEIGWFKNEQQTICAMYSFKALNVNIQVDLQLYHQQEPEVLEYCQNYWFYLAYLMRKNSSCNSRDNETNVTKLLKLPIFV